jgi:signal transduction histidine kinase
MKSGAATGLVQRLAALLRTRERQFWFLQTLGWGTFFVAAYLGALAAEKPVSYNQLISVAAASGYVLSLVLRYVYRLLWQRSPTVFITSAVLLSYLMGLVWTLLKNLVFWEVYRPDYWPDNLMSYFSGAFGSTYVFLCWSGLYFGIKYYQMLQDQRRKTLRANALAHEAQLKMLQYQLNPHFLFNTLNAISTLILERDNDTANLAVTRLSDFLRYTLHNDPMEKVTLEQELKSLHLYLDIEKVRFQDRLHVNVDVEEGARKGRVPSLVTQPIIENAIKYAVAPREEGGHITITANVVQERLIIELADDGPGINGEEQRPGAGRGVGLRNTAERLRQLYGDEYTLELTKARPSGLRVIIGIPYET